MRNISFVFLCVFILLCAPLISAQSQPEIITPEDASDLRVLDTLEGHIGPVNGIAVQPDGVLLASVGDDATLRVWDLVQGQQNAEVYEHFSFVKDVAFNPVDAEMLVTVSWDRTVMIWTVDGEVPTVDRVIQDNRAVIDNIAFSIDGELIAFGVGDGTVRVLEVSSGDEIHEFVLDALPVTDVAFSPDAQFMAAAGGFPDDTAKIWDVETGELVETLTGHLGSVTAIKYHPEGEIIATGGDDATVRLWADGNEEAALVQEDWVVDLAFNPDGSLLAVALQDGTIRLWNVEQEEMVATLDAHDGLVNAIVFDTEGRRLISAGDDGLIKIWGL